MRTTRCKKGMIVVLSVLIVGGPLLAGQHGTGRGGRQGLGLGSPSGPRMGPLRSPAESGRGFAPGWRGGPNRGTALAGVLRRLELTEQQREDIRDILEAAREESQSSRVAVADATKALRTAVAEGADETAVRDVAAGLAQALGDEAVLKASTMASIKEVLTEEQTEQLQEMKRPELRERLGRAAAWGRGFRRGRRLGAGGRGTGRPGGGPGVGPGAGSRIDRLIDRVDTDGDGTLTAEELGVLKEKGQVRPRR